MIQTFEQYWKLNESKQVGIIYHFTNTVRLWHILHSDSLKCSLPNDNAKEKDFYISFTRDKNFHKQLRSNGTTNNVRIAIDGNKLSNKYKINPFNYYKKTYFKDPYDYESEERIKNKVYDEFEIKNLDKYVISYDILKNEYFEYLGARDLSYIEKI